MKSNDYRVIGIHKAGDKNHRINYVTPINTEFIKKIKDFIKVYYTYEYIFFVVKREKKINEEKMGEIFVYLFQNNDIRNINNDEEFLTKIGERFGTIIKNIMDGSAYMEFAKVKWEYIYYLEDIIKMMIKNNELYKSFISWNKIKAQEILNFLKNSNKYIDYRELKMWEIPNNDNRNYDCLIYYIIVSFLFDGQDKNFFIDKALQFLEKEYVERQSSLMKDANLTFIKSFLLNEAGRREDVLIQFNKYKIRVKGCQNFYNQEKWAINLARKRGERIEDLEDSFNNFYYRQKDIDNLKKNMIKLNEIIENNN